MRLWRIVLDAEGEVWTIVVSSDGDAFGAVELARTALPAGARAEASLEELEALYDRSPLGRPGVVRASSVGRARPAAKARGRRKVGSGTRG